MWNDQSIYEQIIQAIYEQRLAPGTRLPELRLCQIFGVSRETVRRVLLRLGEKRYVELTRNVGAQVARPSVREMHDVFHARRVIENETIRLATLSVDSHSAETLEEVLEHERVAHEQGDHAGAIRASGDLHLRLATLAGNALLTATLQDLISQSSLAIALYSRAHVQTCRNHDHRHLIDAVGRGDWAGGQRLMAAHLLEIERQLSEVALPQPQTDLAEVLGQVGEAQAALG
ncbi:GntR family transcriptional regulator [Deinococcus sp. UYEF24]